VLEAVDHVGDTGGLDAMATGGELIVIVLELCVEQLDLVEDLPPPLSILADPLDLCEVFPLVEASHRVTERVVFCRGSVDEVREPSREGIDRFRRGVIGGCV
jgi:hypothetical protein